MSKFIFIIIFYTAINCSTAIAQFSQVQKDLIITNKEKNQIIDTIISSLNSSYVFPETALQVVTAIRTSQKMGDYDNITSSKIFADTISNQMVQIGNDKHLRVLFSYEIVPEKTDKEPPLPDFIKKFAVDNNYGFNRINILEGNIGYLNISAFFFFNEATEKAIASFDYLSNTQSLIIDLRENNGGVGIFANFVLSYFFDQKPVHFLDMNFRKENRTEQSWSSFYIPGKRYLDKPVYILTSHETFSAGEGFAYILQSLKRATIIGEVTGGGANVGDLLRLNNHFVMNLPVGKIISPVTKSNWEGSGVKPDVQVSKENALSTAHIAALKILIERSTVEKRKTELSEILSRIQSTAK